MTLWLVLACMTAIALATVIWPLFRDDVVPSGDDVEVYRDQLAEIARDRQDGLIGAADAEAARVEVSRRLIRAAQASDTSHPPSPAGAEFRKFATLTTAIVLLPVLAVGLYLLFGSPRAMSAGNAVESEMASVDEAAVDEMVREVESYLRESPDDGRGWEALAPVYLRLGRYDDAIRAWQNAIAKLGESADREENLGESYVAANDGTVSKEAKEAFEKALSIDPNDVAARFYTGLAAKQEGRRDDAARIWRDLIAAASPDDEWTDTVRDALARIDESSTAASGGMQPSEQQIAMIKSMVAGLAERLKADGRDPEGWLRLVHSYGVLGDRDRADSAVADAKAALAHDADKLARFENGLSSNDPPSPNIDIAQQDAGRPVSTAAVPPEHDNATMQAVVDRLAERLRNDGGDAESWLMLVRSYDALGEHDRALAAVAQARLALASIPEKLSHFEKSLASAAAASSPTLAKRTEAEKPDSAGATAEQMPMIRSMVDRLAERLKRDDHDIEGWTQLMRSYVVLGQRDQAVVAGRRARVAFGADADALRRIEDTAKALGLTLLPN